MIAIGILIAIAAVCVLPTVLNLHARAVTLNGIWSAQIGAGMCNACCKAEKESEKARRAEEAAQRKAALAVPSAPIPHEDDSLFFYKVKEEEKGPYTLKQLTSMLRKRIKITADVFAGCDSEWLPLLQRFAE